MVCKIPEVQMKPTRSRTLTCFWPSKSCELLQTLLHLNSGRNLLRELQDVLIHDRVLRPLKPLFVGNTFLTKHDLNPFCPSIPLGPLAVKSKKKCSLDATELVLLLGEVKGRICRTSLLDSSSAGFADRLEGDCVLLGEVLGDGLVNLGVEAVVVARVEVVAAQAAVVLDYWTWVRVSSHLMGSLMAWGSAPP